MRMMPDGTVVQLGPIVDERVAELEQQVAALREVLSTLVQDHPAATCDSNESDALQYARLILATTSSTGWVRLPEVERVLRPLIYGPQHEGPTAVTAARAWLDGVKR